MLDWLHIRASAGELLRWKRQAVRFGLSLSEFVRSVMNGRRVRVAMVADPALLTELRRHNSNLNQLLHVIHSGFPVAPERVIVVLDALLALYRREIKRG